MATRTASSTAEGSPMGASGTAGTARSRSAGRRTSCRRARSGRGIDSYGGWAVADEGLVAELAEHLAERDGRRTLFTDTLDAVERTYRDG